ncbi:lipocalin-like domain-containing protein [Streptomyces adustus]|uniref:lipocalin-like domain-containing protein n=1 Tax=Streptomyces adustus TaxID=1609272 RepID=UPI001390F238
MPAPPSKGVGEIGRVGLAPAIANRIFHAAGRRIRSGGEQELTEAARHYLACIGTFRVPDGKSVVHEVALCQYPNWMGDGRTRVARLDGTMLELEPPEPMGVHGRTRTGVLTWERAEPH